MCFRIWDKVIGGSCKILVYVAVAIFLTFKRPILSMDNIEGVNKYLAKVTTLFIFDTLSSVWHNIWMTFHTLVKGCWTIFGDKLISFLNSYILCKMIEINYTYFWGPGSRKQVLTFFIHSKGMFSLHAIPFSITNNCSLTCRTVNLIHRHF